MTILKSDEWSSAHQHVSESLSTLLNCIRDCGYNPSLHVHYDGVAQRLVLDKALLEAHASLELPYRAYTEACDRRDEALLRIQDLPKLDIGF
jgi:hypothetical protein